MTFYECPHCNDAVTYTETRDVVYLRCNYCGAEVEGERPVGVAPHEMYTELMQRWCNRMNVPMRVYRLPVAPVTVSDPLKPVRRILDL